MTLFLEAVLMWYIQSARDGRPAKRLIPYVDVLLRTSATPSRRKREEDGINYSSAESSVVIQNYGEPRAKRPKLEVNLISSVFPLS